MTETANRTDTKARSKQLRAIVKEFFNMHERWVKDRTRPDPDEAYWSVVNTMFDSFAAGEIPGDCRKLSEAITALEQEAAKFTKMQDEDESKTYPHDGFWYALEKVKNALEAKQSGGHFPPLESIKDLHEQKVAHWQIARIYGFVDAEGRPEVNKVEMELKEPGCIIDKKDWKDPRIVEYEARQNAAATNIEELSSRNPNPKAPPCPETPLELFQQGVSVAQAAKMLQVSEEEVDAEFAKFRAGNIPKPNSAGAGNSSKASPKDGKTSKKTDKKAPAADGARNVGNDDLPKE